MRYLLLIFLFSCTELEEIKRDLSESARTAETCEDVTASNGIILEDCNFSVGGDINGSGVSFNLDGSGLTGGFSFSAGGLTYYSQAPAGNNTNLFIASNLFELNMQGSELMYTLQGSPWTITGLSQAPAADRVTNVGGFLRLGVPPPLSIYGVRAGSFSGGSGTSFNVTIPTNTNSTYKVSITPTSNGASAAHYVSNKTTTGFTVTYLASVTGVSFDWIVTP